MEKDKHEDVKHNIKNTKCGGKGVKKCRFFRMYLNLNDSQFKSSRYNYGSTYINLMVTTNQKPTIDTQNQK